MLTMQSFFKFLFKFKGRLKMLKNKLGYVPIIGKYVKMHFLAVFQSLRYLISNNSLKTLLFLLLYKIRKQLRNFKGLSRIYLKGGLKHYKFSLN